MRIDTEHEDDYMTLGEAREILRENWEDGTTCPCCKQFVKLYRRKTTSSAAKSLINLFHHPDEWVHWRDFVDASATGDFARLRYIGLVEKMTEPEPEDKSSTGFWKITPNGRAFVKGHYKISKYMHVYNDHVYKYSGPLVDIMDCLGEKFSYSELMGYDFDTRPPFKEA